MAIARITGVRHAPGRLRKPTLEGSNASLPGRFLSLGPGFSSLSPESVSFVAGFLSPGPGILSLGAGFWARPGDQAYHGKNGHQEYEKSDSESAGNDRPCVQTHMHPSAGKISLGITLTAYCLSRRFPSSAIAAPRSTMTTLSS